MKRTIPALILGGLILAAMVSCKKEDNDKPATSTTTTTSGTTTNPLITKACMGIADVVIDGAPDTLHAMEMVFPPLNLFGIYTDGLDFDVSMQSGAKGLPSKSTIFTVATDPEKMPTATEMILSHYDVDTETDFHAQGGTISYTINTKDKVVKFTNIVFKSAGGETKTISFEAHLK